MLRDGMILGVGTGSTVNALIDLLAARRLGVAAARRGLEFRGLQRATCAPWASAVLDLNDVTDLPLYIDGADEATRARQLIKGGGAALTREKIIAAAAEPLRLHRR